MTDRLSLEIDARELERWAAKLGRVPPAAEKILHTTMQAALDVLEQIVVVNTPVGATGELRQSFMTDIRGTGTDIHGRVFSPLRYGLPVEHGRKPGKMPPVEAIRYWVIRKGIANEEEADSAAFLIARAIGRRGTKGAHMAETALKQGSPIVLKLWRNAMGRIVEAMAV